METGTSDTKCLCKNDFYANTTNVCVTKSALGEVCSNGQPVNQCSVADSECIVEAENSLVYKCFCKATFYRDVQTCKDLTGLQVQNLEVPRDTTGEVYFKITWTIPNTVAFINKYQIKITVNSGTAENLINIDKTENQYNMTNRQPGHTYIVEVISVETASRPGAQTTSVVLQAGTRPAVPSAIITNVILGPSITVSWTVVGIIQHLSGTINGTSVTPKTFNITNIPPSQTPQQQFNTVKNGERYVITVKAYSNGFTSAEFTATIRTTSTRPNPPVINTCDNQDLYENSMNLRWKEPQIPNGDISHYIIYMSYAATRTIITDSSTEVQTIENLLPQQYYCFQMETINDAVSPQSNKSQQSPQKCCLTRAGVAEFPQNVTFTEVKSRSIKLSWMTPVDVKGVLYGYRVSLRVEGECKVEVVYQCTDCDGAQTIPQKSCEVHKKLDINAVDANSKVITTIDGLSPYINYEVWIAAVNGKGDGKKNETFVMTDSEVPEIPGNVVTTVRGSTIIRVSWTKPTIKPGNTTYIVKAYEVLEGKDTPVKEMTVNGYDTETVDFTGLEEYWDYKFTVTASTVKGVATSPMTAVAKTNQAAPGLVQNLNASRPQDANNYTQMDVKWNIPTLRERNGDIKEYILMHNISGVMTAVTPRTNADSDNLMETLSVATEQWYKIEVTAVNTIPQEGQPRRIMYYAEPGPPLPPTFSPVTTEVSKAVSTQRTISVELNGDWFFYNKDNGVFTDWGVIVCTGDKCDNYGAGTGTKAGNPFGLGTFKTWKEAQKTGFVEPYRATNNTWIYDKYKTAVGRRKRSSHEVEFMLGEDNDCSKREDTVYCNGPLAPGKSYIIVAFTCTAGGCTESDRFGPFPTQPEPEDVPIAIIAGAAAAVVVFIILVIIIVVIKKKRNRNQPKKMEEEAEPDFTNPAGLETPSVERKNIKKQRPVRMRDFEAKIEELHKDSNLRFAHEYEELKTLTDPKTLKGVTTLLAETEDNKLKNRYVNILPYDHTIVKLLPLGDDDEEASTFINANYIPGYKSQREYIASQGPIPSTIDDFWRMVWEQSVSIIVMLTLAKEDGRIKCETYWPTEQSEAKQYGDIVVDMQSCSTINTYEFRIFKLTLGDKSRTLKHFHFLNWKDFSANVQNDVMVDFISNVRSHVTIPESRVPMIVHCSAGVGRTGTFIALDHMMQFIKDHDFNSTIDIFDFVVKMRKCRMYMVQTEQQYIFIHDCIKDILEKKRQKELEDGEGLDGEGLYGNVGNPNNQDNIYSNDAFEPDQDLYQNVDMAQPKTEL
ncbi:tyrosine-protein phosphatase 10D-like [Mytilus californianus]|uniref:tyrosine-protein phosphatase 10D-like n=1 Tax=Mytilus californianus TaxID=6549 RepID=UPI00224851EF|nr:tyrosine-protein phosphatase 10D-like [Mytilus californianus]